MSISINKGSGDFPVVDAERVDAPTMRHRGPAIVVIVADIVRALRAAENVDRIVMPTQKPVRAEIADLCAYGWRCCRARSPSVDARARHPLPWLDADSAIRTQHTRNLVATVGDTCKLPRPAGHSG
jgi:hypothetical protein